MEIAMKSSCTGMQKMNRRFNVEGLRGFLRRKHPAKTAENVSAETGVPVSTIHALIYRGQDITGSNLLALVAQYGPDALHAAWDGAPEWLSTVARHEKRDAILDEIRDRHAALKDFKKRG